MFPLHPPLSSVRLRSVGLVVAVGVLSVGAQPIGPGAVTGVPETATPSTTIANTATPAHNIRETTTEKSPAHRSGPDISPDRPPTSDRPVEPPGSTVGAAAPPSADGSSPFSAITSPDVGEHCAADLSADGLTAFFSRPIGSFRGGDYQRALRLNDDRVLWTFQDAFVGGTLVHNVGMLQSGRCFTLLNDGARSWLLTDTTRHMVEWHWILDGVQDPDGSIHLFVAQMRERGDRYLSRTEPTALRRVVLHPDTFDVIDVIDEAPTGLDLYGWSVTSDASYVYLYSHCYRQFGFVEPLGFDGCAEYVKLARAPIGSLSGPRQYWTGNGWSDDALLATPVIDRSFAGAENNPAQIRFDGSRFLLVEKLDDWWGGIIEFAVADAPQGPFRPVASTVETLKCELWSCNTYFAAWVPWKDPSGAFIWSLGHNRWNGAETASHLDVYRPTFHLVVA